MSTKDINSMTLVEIARRLAELGEAEKTLEAYAKALKQESIAPDERLEAACAVFQYGDDYKMAYDAFLTLYREGQFKEDVFAILTDAFYTPNVKLQKKRYEKNCKLLANYKYLFRKDFLPFEELPVQFYPYDDNGVLPFYKAEERFDPYTDIKEPIIRHYFFKDLEKPVLATDIFSQYELEYLRDNVRRSDWVARENHIYLHYTNWGEFCAWLQVLDVKPLLEEEKIVFLIGEEISQYPIDFKERFGIDYSQYPVKPIGIREVNKIIWHTQLHAHNGGDFFNEILDDHPNLFAGTSLIFEDHLELTDKLVDTAREIAASNGELDWGKETKERYGELLLRELVSLKPITRKDAFVAIYLGNSDFCKHLSYAERIVPVVMFQPHDYYTDFGWEAHPAGGLKMISKAFEEIKQSGLVQQFKYIKTFTPMRRPTTSHAATLRFMNIQVERGKSNDPDVGDKPLVVKDELFNRFMNRTFMVSPMERLFADSRLVRFEDAKLNPTAVFTALAEFLDIPYTESMTYCSDIRGRMSHETGFRTETVYKTYDEFCDPHERRLIEYLLRDAYEEYGYSFEQYDGSPMSLEELENLLEQCTCNFEWSEKSWWKMRDRFEEIHDLHGEELDCKIRETYAEDLEKCKTKRRLAVKILSYGMPFCDENGEPLQFMKQLELDPNLLEQPLYH